ncbi:ABC transporter substrate-binding protein [Alkalihalobacillus sp. BA299]|uniref:ABC transporter substrate-binding protein n=1 Tax=Alkalihalobacillus sp. BA299 TaxID=2815938 RepID=UPI001AD9830F|nr:ABC transporter substrate-binding protein [Alkalihalobacillus sp. BA299]
MKKYSICLLVLLLLLITGCSQSSSTSESKESTETQTGGDGLTGTFVIGEATAMTGPWSEVHNTWEFVSSMAIEEIEESGIIGNVELKLIREDAGDTTEAGIMAVQRLLKEHKAKVIVGLGADFQTLAAFPQIQNAGNVIGLGINKQRDIAKIGDWIFSLAPDVTETVPELTEKQHKAFGFESAVLVTVQDSKLAVDGMKVRKETLESLGVEILAEETVLASDTDFTPLVTKIMNLNPEIVMTGNFPPGDPMFIEQLKRAGYKGLFAGDANSSSEFLAEVFPIYEGQINGVDWVPGYPGENERSKQFTEKYIAKFDKRPDHFDAQYYDGLWRLAHAISEVGNINDIEAIRDKYQSLELETLRGMVTIDEDGVPSPTTFPIQVKEKIYVPLDVE